MTLEEKTYQSTPATVAAVKYDGTEACAQAICKKWQGNFVIGTDTEGAFEGLYLLIGNNAFAVTTGDMVYQNVKEKCVFAIPEDTFFELFHEVKSR